MGERAIHTSNVTLQFTANRARLFQTVRGTEKATNTDLNVGLSLKGSRRFLEVLVVGSRSSSREFLLDIFVFHDTLGPAKIRH